MPLVSRFLLLTLALLYGMAPAAGNGPPKEAWRFVHFLGAEANDNESIGFVKAILKDSDGFMWFGGESGLARFNGHKFEVYRHRQDVPSSIAENYVWDLMLDHNQNLWAATGKSISRYNRELDNFSVFTTDSRGAPFGDVRDLAEDPHHNIWVVTASGLHHLDASLRMMPAEPAFAGKHLQTALPAGDDLVWVGTRGNGFAKFEPGTQKITWYPKETSPHALPDMDVRALFFKAPSTLWIGTFGAGIFKFDTATEQFQHYPQVTPDQRMWSFTEDKNGTLWAVSEGGGLQSYDATTDTFTANINDPLNPDSLAFSKAQGVYVDPDNGDIWVGLFPYGVDLLNQSANQILRETARTNGLSDPGILSIQPAADGKLWIGTENGLNLYDPKTRETTQFLPDKLNPHGLRANAALSLALANNNQLWVGTWGGGLHLFDPPTGKFHQLPILPRSTDGIGNPYIWSLLHTQDSQLYVGTEGGLHHWLGGEKFERFMPNPNDPHSVIDRSINALFEDSKHRIWVGTGNGLDEFIPSTKQFAHHLKRPDGLNMFGNYIVAITEDSSHNIWLTSREGGVTQYNPEAGTYKNYTREQGMPSDYVASLREDGQGYMWATTVHGAARIDPKTGAIITLTKSDGLVGNNFNRNASYFDALGNLYLGSAAGLNILNPQAFFAQSTRPPKVVIADLRLFNKPVAIGEPGSVLQKAITHTDSITLTHEHTMVSFDFFALSFRSPFKNQYAYMLEGFDNDWIDIGSHTSATYTNLPAGDYVFKVKASDNLGHWNVDGDRIQVRVKPAPWLSHSAYAIYSMLMLFGLYGVYCQQRNRLRHRHAQDRLALEQEKARLEFDHEKALNAKLQQVDKLKDAFLANTSHELRTPLNGIIGLSDALIGGSQGAISDGVRFTLEMISISGRRLSYLINDILDFSKISKRDLDLNLKPTSIYDASCIITELVRPLINGKQLTLINNIPATTPLVIADPNRIQQVLINLVGNAIKFTAEGSVILNCRTDHESLIIEVIDTGSGISVEDQSKLFIEFSRLENEATRTQSGTGLGLAICKQLVQRHGSELKINSTLGKGSTFYFSLPLAPADDAGEAALAAAVAATAAPATLTPTPTPTPQTGTPPVSAAQINAAPLLMPADIIGRFTILVVDDDAINRMVLRGILGLHQHTVVEASSGSQALQLLKERDDIDLAILDVMMPGMNGFETAMRIRVTHQVHHLPIIFLTAKDYGDDLVRGYVAGGNDFLTKPVSKHELLTRTASHLRLLQIHRAMERKIDDNNFEHIATQNELVVLDNIIASLQQEMDPDKLVFTLLDQMLNIVETANGASFWQLDAQSQLVCSAALAQGHRQIGEQCFKITPDFAAALASLAQSPDPVQPLLRFQDSPLQPLWDLFLTPENTLIAPIHHGAEALGFVALTHTTALPDIDPTIIAALQRIKSHISSVILKANALRR